MAGIRQTQQKIFDERVQELTETNMRGTTLGGVFEAIKHSLTLNPRTSEETYDSKAILPDGPYPLPFVANALGIGFEKAKALVKEGHIKAYYVSGNNPTMVTKENFYAAVDWLQTKYEDDGLKNLKQKNRTKNKNG